MDQLGTGNGVGGGFHPSMDPPVSASSPQTAFIMSTPSLTSPPPAPQPMEVDSSSSSGGENAAPPPASQSSVETPNNPVSSQNGPPKLEGSAECMAILGYLQKNNMTATLSALLREAKLQAIDIDKIPMETDVTTVLSSYASDENPDEYTDAYNQLRNFIDTSLDSYKFEVGQVLWPVFVHMYLELIYNDHETQAASYFQKFSRMQETFHDDDLNALGSISKKNQLLNSENPFKMLTSVYGGGNQGGLYVVRMSREAQSLLKRFLQEKRLKLIQNIVQDRIHIEVYDGMPRGKAAVSAVSGHIMGEALKQDNKAKVYYGLLREPDLNDVRMDEDDEDGSTATISTEKKEDKKPAPVPAAEDEKGKVGEGQKDGKEGQQPGEKGGGGGGGSSKKKKGKKDWLLNKKGKNDPNAPPLTRFPLPELRDVDKIEKAKALRESAKRVTLGPDKLPSCCFYTVLNGDNQVTSLKWSEDGTLMAIGLASSLIKVWALTGNKLRRLKAASELAEIDREADDVLVRMMDDSTESFRCLRGHSGPVYSLDFSPDKMTLLSSSEDTSIRLWNLLTWTCVVVYKGHLFPVWKAVFSPHGGYYFASAGYDCTARLWATDSYSALRIFAGHYADVTSIIFHPNSNYVATGSADRSVRLWDCLTGSCVRLMTGHKGKVHALQFSVDGRFLVSSASDSKVLIWDMANGGLLTSINLHQNTVYSLAFSREGNVLATGGLDYCVRLWDFMKMIEDVVTEDGGGAVIPPDVKKISADNMLIGEFYTKATPIYALHFTRRNILVASGPWNC